MNEDNLPKFLSVKQVASRLGVSRMTIFRYIKREENPLPVVYFSDTTLRIPVDQFEIWLKSMGFEETPQEVAE